MSEPVNLFGTDGIRDRAGERFLSAESLERVGFALASFVRGGVDNLIRDPRILIGRDTRTSGPEIESILASAFARRGCVVDRAGVVPTPAVSNLVAELDYDLGIVISASHNPPDFNGVKVFDRRGQKLDVISEERITALYHNLPDGVDREHDDHVNRDDLVAKYLDGFAPFHGQFEGMTIVLDCAFGATAPVAKEAYESTGARVIVLNTELDGSRINVDCGSLNPGLVAERVLAEKADLGVAFDGDGDRAILVDETGQVVDGDEVMALWALALKAQGKLTGDVLVATVMSNAGMESYLRDNGVELIRTSVGDREVFQEMELRDAALGGEQSGHIIDRAYAATGDGIRTGLSMASLIRSEGKPLSVLRKPIPRFPQILLGVEVVSKVAFNDIPEVVARANQIETTLEGRGRLLLRYSGTEPLARILIEGPDPSENESLANGLADTLRGCAALH